MSEKIKKEIDLYLINLLTEGIDDKSKTNFYQIENNIGYSPTLPQGAKYLKREELLQILKKNPFFHLFTGLFFTQGEKNWPANYTKEYTGAMVWVAGQVGNGNNNNDTNGSKFEAGEEFDISFMTLKLLEKFRSGQLNNIELFNCRTPPGFLTYGENHYDFFTQDKAELINFYNNRGGIKISSQGVCAIIKNLHSSIITRKNCYAIANFILKWLDMPHDGRGQIVEAALTKFSGFFQKIDNCNTFYNYILQHHISYKDVVYKRLLDVNKAFDIDTALSSFTFNENKVQHLNINMSSLIAKYPALLGANFLKSNFESIIKKCIKIASPLVFNSNLNIEFIDFYGHEKFGKNLVLKTKSQFVPGVDEQNTAKIIEFAFSTYLTGLNTEIAKFKTTDNASRIDFDRGDVLNFIKSYEEQAMQELEERVKKAVGAHIDKISLEMSLGDTEIDKLKKEQSNTKILKNSHKI